MRRVGSALFVLLSIAAPVCADTITHGNTTINMDFVSIGNAGNAADTTGSPNPCGSVGYVYNIGTYEVTADQWAGVIAADPNVGTAGPWSGSQPAASVSFNRAARFCNWLTTGHWDQGYYTLNLAGNEIPNALGHDAYAALYGTTYFIPTEDEWYKAAYYNGNTGAYYDYPTGSNLFPDGVDSAGDAAFEMVFNQGYNQGQPNSVEDSGLASPYGTFGQGGNVLEWNETLVNGNEYRGLRGGYWNSSANITSALVRSAAGPGTASLNVGFRVASAVPEPGSIVLLLAGAIAGFVWWWRRK
jgi:formylglycine-generating enzyme